METKAFLEPWLGTFVPWLYWHSHWWTVFGLMGNMIFGSRFLVQWWSSERRRKLHVPAVFWHLSFWGGVVSFVYALHIDKLPVILSTFFLPLIYGRNLVLLRRGRLETATQMPPESTP